MNTQGGSRQARKSRSSRESEISLNLELDGSGQTNIKTGFGLLDHMLTLAIFWGGMNLDLACKGDLFVDAHHSTEDIGLCLGSAFLEALGDRSGIARVGYGRVPMDEAISEVSIDISGRPWLEWRGDELLPCVMAGEEKDVWREFCKAFASSARINLHVNFLYGKNGHHLLESAFKGLGLALRQAMQVEGGTIKSSKGVLD